MFIFLKATVPGGASSDLFTTPVEVHGYTTKHGTYVAPHHSTRHKRAEQRGQSDLFAAPAPLPEEQKRLVALVQSARQRFVEEGDAEAVAGLDALLEHPAKIHPDAAREIIHAASERWTEKVTREATEKRAAEAKEQAASPDAMGDLGRAAAEHPEPENEEASINRQIDAEEAAHRAIWGGVKPGQTLWSKSGRKLTVPNYTGRTARARLAAWLVAEAQKEEPPASETRWVADAIQEMDPRNLSPTDSDLLRETLFGDANGPGPANRVAPSPSSSEASVHLEPASRAEETPISWGVPAGTSKARRRKFNAAAVALLDGKQDADMTADDRQVLARYTGRGGIGDSLNEFYTDPAVASAMWSMMANSGFAGGNVLEPSSGTGVFLHTAPVGTRVTAVELDPTSARIAGILHRPAGHEVDNASLERFATQDARLFDAVIGNAPFGLRGSLIRDDKPDLSTADQYFLDTALDKTRDGGLVAIILPTGIMDSKNGRAFREQVLTKGEFLGAHRLPNTAFEASHTGVTSDIVVFRKRPQESAGALSTLSQDQLKSLGVWDDEFLSGGYFAGRGASQVMGRMEAGWRAKAGMGQDITVSGDMRDVPEALAKWGAAGDEGQATPSVERILETIGEDPAARRRAVSAALKPPYQVAKPGDVRVINGIRYVLQGEPPRWHRADDAVPEAVEDARAIGEMIDDLAEGRAKDPRFARAKLAELLDEYVKEHGVPARNRDLTRWLSAPHMPASWPGGVHDMQRVVARLLGAVSDDGSYSDLITGHQREHEDASLDTVATKLSLETGGFTVDQLADISGGDRGAVLDHLFASPAYAVEADGVTWTTLDSYIGGDLWAKLDAARAAAAHEGIAPEFKGKYGAQIAALDEAIAPQSLEDVDIQINSGFVTPKLISAWFDARSEAYQERNPNSQYNPGGVAFSFSDGIYTAKPIGSNGWLPPDADLVMKYLNRAGVRKDDRDKLERLNREFRDWLLTSPYRDQIEESYNRQYRGFRAPAYSDTPIAVPGLNPALDVNRYHFAGLRWALQAGKGIIAADVGLGKTGRGLMLAKLAKVTGQANKPTFVVPKSVLANWVAEAAFWFPGSRVHVIGETYTTDANGNITSKADDEATRRRKFQELSQNDYDFVFISQPTWNDLDVDPITKGQYANDDFWTKRGDALGNAGDKRLNQIRTAYEQALAKREFSKREDTVYFGDLGIDMLLLDEAHAYKNLYAAKNRFGESPKFLGGSGLSNRAQDTYFKTRQLRERNGGKGVFMLTATPTKNSPLEVYSMLSHIAPEAFDRMGIKNSEDFLDRFCVFETDNILGVDGTIQEALVTAGFKNLGELREVMRRYIDRKTAEDVGLKLPQPDRREHMIDMTPEQESVYQLLRHEAQEAGSDAEGASHIFSVMDRMGKASVDLALLPAGYTAGLDTSRSPKIEACVAEAVKGAADGGQIIFCEHVDLHEPIAAALVRSGIPRKQIGIVNAKAAASSASRQKISDDFNAGKLKVVIGNVTMSEGMNLQKQTSDIHHLDIPWEPSTIQQRNGRGLRQGNKSESVRLHTYLAKGSFDGYRWQTVAAKKDWQDLLWNGGDRVENLARQGGVSRSDMLIMLSANPDEARIKYESDKAAAEQRKSAEETGKAIDTFGRFQEMRMSLHNLRARKADGTAVQRLEHKIARLHDTLTHNRYFEHKDLLDEGAEPALVEPSSHTVFRKGVAFDLGGGRGGPMAYSNEPTRWVVRSVDPEAKTVNVRQWGSDGDDYSVDIDLDRMKAGVTPFSYDAKAEEEHIEAERKRQSTELEARLAKQAGASAEGVKLTDLHKVPPETLAKMGPQLQERLKDALRSYRLGGHFTHHALVGPDGAPNLVPYYEAKDLMGDHDFLLPTAEGREQAIGALVNDTLGRTISTNYAPARRRSARMEERGVKGEYPAEKYGGQSSPHSPWHRVVSDVFGQQAAEEALRRVSTHVHQGIADAPTFRDAMIAAQPTYDASPWVQGNRWPTRTAKALWDKAKALGVLDQPIETAAAPDATTHRAKLHRGMIREGASSYVDPKRTVRQYLERSLSASDREPEAEPEESA